MSLTRKLKSIISKRNKQIRIAKKIIEMFISVIEMEDKDMDSDMVKGVMIHSKIEVLDRARKFIYANTSQREKDGYKRYGTISVKDVLPKIGWNAPKIELFGFQVKTSSIRLLTFKNGIKCIHCGLEGKYFAIEDNHSGAHLNLYTRDEFNMEIMMTSDHIIPKSRGGKKYSINNRQCLCKECNVSKGGKLEAEVR